MIKQIATVAVYVDNQEEALSFWRDKVGFEVRRNESMGPAGNWLEVAPSGAETCLVLYPKSVMPNWQEFKPSIVFICQDIQQTYEKLKANGVEFKEEPKKMRWGTFAIFKDPEGNEFVIKE
ncbi:VOC family protein [Thermoflavimicrobium dichotomicum]|nr:VOC family protein [Thermoflavimicrobium dichotomicum]